MLWESDNDIVKDPFLHPPITRTDYKAFLDHRSDEYKPDYDAHKLFAKISTVPETSTIVASLAKYVRTHSDIRHFSLSESKYYPIDVEEEEADDAEEGDEEEEAVDVEAEDEEEAAEDKPDAGEEEEEAANDEVDDDEEVEEEADDVYEASTEAKEVKDEFMVLPTPEEVAKHHEAFEALLPAAFNPSTRELMPITAFQFHPLLFQTIVGIHHRFNIAFSTITLASSILGGIWDEPYLNPRRDRPLNPFEDKKASKKSMASSTKASKRSMASTLSPLRGSHSSSTRKSKKSKTSKK